jgi:hypothetical protein
MCITPGMGIIHAPAFDLDSHFDFHRFEILIKEAGRDDVGEWENP